MRVTAMVAVIAVALLGGCVRGSDPDAPSGDAPAVDEAVPPGPPGTSAPPGPPVTSAPPRSTPAPTRGGGPADDEVPGPLPLPARTLSGTVQRLGACTVLLTGQRRWALTGTLAARLKVGQRLKVSGPPVTVPSACKRVEAFQAIHVDRVESA